MTISSSLSSIFFFTSHFNY